MMDQTCKFCSETLFDMPALKNHYLKVHRVTFKHTEGLDIENIEASSSERESDSEENVNDGDISSLESDFDPDEAERLFNLPRLEEYLEIYTKNSEIASDVSSFSGSESDSEEMMSDEDVSLDRSLESPFDPNDIENTYNLPRLEEYLKVYTDHSKARRSCLLEEDESEINKDEEEEEGVEEEVEEEDENEDEDAGEQEQEHEEEEKEEECNKEKENEEITMKLVIRIRKL